MFKLLVGVAIGTQVGPYVNPYIIKFVMDPLLQKMQERDLNTIEQWVNNRKR